VKTEGRFFLLCGEKHRPLPPLRYGFPLQRGRKIEKKRLLMALIALGVNAMNYAGFNALICSGVNTAKEVLRISVQQHRPKVMRRFELSSSLWLEYRTNKNQIEF
jgi:hypothetical protein